MENKRTEAQDGKRPNLNSMRDELDFEGMGYTPKQIKSLWDSLSPKEFKNNRGCELLFGTAGIVEEGQTLDISTIGDENSLNNHISWKECKNPITSSSGSPSPFIHDEIGQWDYWSVLGWDGQQKTVNNTESRRL